MFDFKDYKVVLDLIMEELLYYDVFDILIRFLFVVNLVIW